MPVAREVMGNNTSLPEKVFASVQRNDVCAFQVKTRRATTLRLLFGGFAQTVAVAIACVVMFVCLCTAHDKSAQGHQGLHDFLATATLSYSQSYR